MSLSSIFKAYDVRGPYPEAIDEATAEAIGRATASHLGCRTALVGHDMRRSSPALARSLIQGLRSQGVDVTFIGEASSPLIYFAGREHDAALAVTASHNPLPDNGMKICARGARPIGSASGLLEIRDLVIDGEPSGRLNEGKLERLSPREEFVDAALAGLRIDRPFRVVVDGGNGIGGPDYAELARRDLPLEILPLYLEPDDNFPHHAPNPLDFANLADLQREVMARGADLGIGLDGDADRCLFVDDEGEILPADLATALMAQDALTGSPGAAVLFDVRSSRVVAEEIEAAGGRPVECRVGHAFIKQRMREEQAPFGGELSGHYYFRESSYAENTLIALFRVLNILAKRGESLSQVARSLRRYASSGEINSRVDDVDAVLSRLAGRYSEGEISRLDGLKISFEDWWFNVRPSNTEPLLRLVLEATSEESMIRRRDELLALIRA